MSTASWPTVKTQLVALLAARPNLAGVQVTYRWAGDAVEQDTIWLGDVTGRNEYPVMRAGRKKRQEEYTVTVTFASYRPDDWGSAADVRVAELVAELEDMVADDPQIGLGATMPTLVVNVADYTLTTGPLDPAGWGSQISVQLEISHRLT